MTQKMCKLSIVCPAFEEEEGLTFFHQELSEALEPLADEYAIEVVYVDDGSGDRTLQVIQEIAFTDRRVRYLSFSRNFGYQAALTAGMEHATGDVVVTLDADLQHPPALIGALVEKWRQGYDVVVAVRRHDPHPTWCKRLASRGFYRLMELLADAKISPGATDFRLLSRRAVDALVQLRETHRFLRGLVPWLGLPSAEVPFTPSRRVAGASKYTCRHLIDVGLDALFSFSKAPLRLALGLGLLAASFGLIASIYSVVRWLFFPAGSAAGWAFLAGSIYLVGGGILCALGLVGEYVGRIFDQVKGRPLYLVKDSSLKGANHDCRPRFEKTTLL